MFLFSLSSYCHIELYLLVAAADVRMGIKMTLLLTPKSFMGIKRCQTFYYKFEYRFQMQIQTPQVPCKPWALWGTVNVM